MLLQLAVYPYKKNTLRVCLLDYLRRVLPDRMPILVHT